MSAGPCQACGRLLGPDAACPACGRPTRGAPDWSPPFTPTTATGPAGSVLASVWQRLAAGLIDVAALLTAVSSLSFAVLALAGAIPERGKEVDDTRASVAGLAILALLLLGFVVYETVLIGRSGATFGKRALQLEVRAVDGGPCGYQRALMRSLVGRVVVEGVPTMMAGAGLLSYLLAGNDEQRQTWHDRIAGTIVVRA